jgi:hypothetical protein
MQDKAKASEEANAERDLRRQGSVLSYIVSTYPHQIRMAELIQELTADSGETADRIWIEDAVMELRGAGLLFRCEAMVLPTRAAIRAYEVWVDTAA